MNLNCYCDHCPNNTCTTEEGGLCYAEWAIKTALSGTTNLNNNIIQHSSHHHLHHQSHDNYPLQLERKFNCFHKDNILFQSIVCNETVSNTSNIIRKCCNDKDYCNTQADLLPTEEQAYNLFETYWPPKDDANKTLGAKIWSSIQQYSSLPLEIKIILIILTVLLLVFTITTVYTSLTRRRAGRRLKTKISNFIKGRRNNAPSSVNGSAAPSTSRVGLQQTSGAFNRRHIEGDFSENSLGKTNSDVAVYDTNSMASREPLLNSTNQRNHLKQSYQPNGLDHHHPTPFMTDETYNGKAASTFQMTLGTEPCGPETSSGSGAGQPYLTQRSIAHDIELVEVVGRGFFGVVWRGNYKGEPVAVKIFSPMAELSWEREAEIYQTTLLRHKNILGFIATDKRHDAAMTGFWLVTDFYPMGSLCDFLHENSMSMADALRMAFSLANGLAHLHVEIFGTQGKPAIAHRDLKSKNVLVKNDGTCCIADLGMAVRYNSSTGIVDVPTNSRVGTRRYLAPEILDNQLNLMDFEAVKATDVYALGLVLWEILRRACLIHPSSNLDPEESYYLEQQQATALTSERSSSPGRRASTEDATAYVDAANGRDVNIAPGADLGANQQSATITPARPHEDHPLTSTPQASTFSQLPPSANMAPTQMTPLKLLLDSMNTTINSTPADQKRDYARLCDPYEPPYHNYVSNDPTAEEMRSVVVDQRIRPTVSIRWTKLASFREYVALMGECWYEKPQSRVSALRVRKSLSELARKHFNLNLEFD